MPVLDEIAPQLLPDVLVRPLDEDGECVVKNPRKRTYLRLGEHESFLLRRLNGQATYGFIKDEFERRFSEPITADDLVDFVTMARDEGLVAKAGEAATRKDSAPGPAKSNFVGLLRETWKQARKQSPLYFRVKVFDPDRSLNWLEPKTRWLFSREMAIAATLGTLLALLLIWVNRHELITQFASGFGWRMFSLTWLTIILVSICHEYGHGLACKRYGGEVHEMGTLWLFFTPCFYCNVSDAWLLPNRWQRFLISMAGTYFDLLIWIAAVLVWRVTSQQTALNFMAWIVVTTCGLRVSFNINPLLRLDGYYALSDFLGVHNLRRRGRQRWMEYVRWLLWGAERPQPMPDGRALLWYGVISWFFTVCFLNVLFFKVSLFLKSFIGVAGFVAGAGFFIAISKRYFRGSLGKEFAEMFRTRRRRLLVLFAASIGVLLIPISDRASGPFQVRPVIRWEVRAPVAGFLRELHSDQGNHVETSDAIARMEVPELLSQIARKEAEIHESEAILRRLEAGPRPEEVAEQRERVQRGIAWRDLAEHDLQQSRVALQEELSRLDLQISQANSELEFRNTILEQAKQLFEKGGLAGRQLLAETKQTQDARLKLQQVEAEKRARVAAGVLSFEAELARREKELADIRAALALLEAGSRPEDIEAERARLARLQEEANHLATMRDKQLVTSPIPGTITTPRLKEKMGQYLERGALICVVEDLASLEAEIAVSEQEARKLVPGQEVTLKARSLPYRSLTAKVDRIAPSTLAEPTTTAQPKPSNSESTVTVYCQVDNPDGLLRTGMTGFGRIYDRSRPLGWIVMDRTLQFVRTEFWW